MAQVAKKKTWKEMRDEVFDRSGRFLGAGIILLLVGEALTVVGLIGQGILAEEELFKWILRGVAVLGIVCFVILAPFCFVFFFKLDKKWREI